LDCLGEGVSCAGGGEKDVWWEEVQAEREIGRGEDGQCLDKDIGYGFVFG